MSTMLEKSILAQVNKFVSTTAYTPSEAEKECLDTYSRNTMMAGAMVLGFFVWAGTRAIRPELMAMVKAQAARNTQHLAATAPRSLNAAQAAKAAARMAKADAAAKKAGDALPEPSVFNLALAIGAVSGSAFVATYYTAKWCGTECLACLLKTKGGEQKLGDLVQEMLITYHPNHVNFLKAAERALPAGSEDAGEIVSAAADAESA
ncbi:hypothetical protein H9P43_001921 [Blastocladiella emersonii ATCC 22665]|nr:hypothetical protein H9P43_001921 [Blastocladiella emersonii ATCC 22665]